MPTLPPNSIITAADVPIPTHVINDATSVYQQAYISAWLAASTEMEKVENIPEKMEHQPAFATDNDQGDYYRVPDLPDPLPNKDDFRNFPSLYWKGYNDGWNAAVIAYIQYDWKKKYQNAKKNRR